MASMTGSEFAAKWANRISAATQDMQRGIENVTVSPTSLAAKKQAKMLSKLTEAVNNGKWAASLNAVTVDQWKKATIEKGLPRVNAGAQAAQDKMAAFGQKLMSYQDAGLPAIRSMADMTIQDSINRASAWITYMSKFKK